MKNVVRPLPEGYGAVTYQDQFELRYLRWDYLVKTENPTENVLKSKEAIVRYCARRAYKKYASEFNYMCMELNDLENIARIYVVEYLGLYSSKNNKKVRNRHRQKIKNKGKEPSKKEMILKDNYSLIYFVEQRLAECAHVFRQKSKNQAGYTDINLYIQKTQNLWPSDEELSQNPTKFGWAKASWSFLSKIKKTIPFLYPGLAFEFDGKICRIASNSNKFYDRSLDYEKDRRANFEFYNIKSPEDILIELEDQGGKAVCENGDRYIATLEERIKSLIDLFYQRPLDDKIRIIKRTISYLKRRDKNDKFKKEILYLKRFLAKIKG